MLVYSRDIHLLRYISLTIDNFTILICTDVSRCMYIATCELTYVTVFARNQHTAPCCGGARQRRTAHSARVEAVRITISDTHSNLSRCCSQSKLNSIITILQLVSSCNFNMFCTFYYTLIELCARHMIALSLTTLIRQREISTRLK